ncbi:MAG: IseA DL-endopeptidase inhibitor family protein [Oscillospiraceae bacterium]|nr:IseA DL-endopeptidase inhibitor family protein [Oscillospiraceae bacterium]
MKKLICVLLSLVTLLTFCSCGATEKVEITDEEIVALIDGDIQVGKYLYVYCPSTDWDNAIEYEGKIWYPVVQEGFETWDEWEAYIYSVYCGEWAEYALTNESYKNIDGKLYCDGGDRGYDLTDDYVYEILENADGTAKVKVTNPGIDGDFAQEYTLIMTLTDDGWRVSGQE